MVLLKGMSLFYHTQPNSVNIDVVFPHLTLIGIALLELPGYDLHIDVSLSPNTKIYCSIR